MSLKIISDKNPIGWSKSNCICSLFILLTKLSLEHLIREHGLDSVKDWSRILSVGEQQRLGFVRILLNKPDIVIADEPTGNLDHENSVNVFKYLIDYIESEKMTLVMATHNQEWANKSDRRIDLS